MKMSTKNASRSRREFLTGLAGASSLALAWPSSAAAETPATSSAGRYNVRDFGAIGDGSALETHALQAAIDACAQAGGGTVLLPPGTYRAGTLFLKSHVTLSLENGATLRGSANLDDYPKRIPSVRSYTDEYTERSLLYGEGLENIAITGQGVIDGQGARFKGSYKVRPYLIRMIACRNVCVKDITLKDSPMWVQHYLACDGVYIDGIRVQSRCNGNNDGIDIDGCQQVRIANCEISSGDDAIVLKSTLDRPCRNVVITNCLLTSLCNAFKLGTESNGGFKDIALNNCVIYDTNIAGIALELVDGGTLDGVNISNVVMRNTKGAIFIRLGNRARPFAAGMAKPGQGKLRNIKISGIQADGADTIGCSVTGLPDALAENITIADIRIRFAGGVGPEIATRAVPEVAEKYPEHGMFNVLPAYGFYCRHVRGLRFSHVQLECVKPDGRPSLLCDDVEDLAVQDWDAAATSTARSVMHFRNVRKARVQGCRSSDLIETFVELEGTGNEAIRLIGNDASTGARNVAGENVESATK